MTFDSHSLERLKELGRKLPKEISKSKQNEPINQKKNRKPKLHPVEIETNPEKLFRELMETSTDGNVPPHLIERLKNLESKSIQVASTKDQEINKDFQELSTEDSQTLYTQFKQFLLEDDIDY